jgi:hypothetical protein
MIFPISKSCHKILKHVYESNGTKISRLLRETSVSQRVGYKHITELMDAGILTQENIGSLRIIKPNINSETGRLVFGLIEKERELELVSHKPQLHKSLTKLKREARSYLIESAVLFGPFLRNHDGNINILVISESNDKKVLSFLHKCFSNIENSVSAQVLSKRGFIKFRIARNDYYQEMLRYHVCVYNTQRFIQLISLE